MTGRYKQRAAAAALGILLAVCPCVFAQDPSLDISQYSHRAWTVRDGFFKGLVGPIAQTPDGYIWLGTPIGLVRFDGVKTVNWPPPQGQQLPSNRVMSLLASRDGTLWIGTEKGLASFKKGKLTQYPETADHWIFAVVEDREGTVWASALTIMLGKICAIRNDGMTCAGEGTIGRGAFNLYADSKGTLWAGVKDGVWRWNPGPPKFYSLPGEPDGIQGLGETEDGTLLVAWNGKLNKFRDGETEPYPLPGIAGLIQIRRILRDRAGSLWLSTVAHGLLHLHSGSTDVFAQFDGLSGDAAKAPFEDAEGDIWVPTSNGVDRFRAFAVPTLTTKQGLSHDLVTAVLADKDGSLWFSTWAGLDHWRNGNIEPFPLGRSGNPNDLPASLFQDRSSRIWVAKVSGFGYLEGRSFVPLPSVPQRGLVLAIAQDRAGDLWLANERLGLFHVQAGNAVRQITWESLGHKDHASVLAADPRGGLWVGFFLGGIAYLENGEVRAKYTAADGLEGGRVSGLHFDSDGALWISTEAGGLSRLKNGRITRLNSKNGLPCDLVSWVTEDDDHAFWLYTPCGLIRITRPELEAWITAVDQNKDTKPVIQTTVFDSFDGVRSVGTPGHYSPLIAKTSDGRIWFLPSDGVSVLDPRNLHLNKLPPPVHIEQITADRKIYDVTSAATGNVRLPPLIRDLQIDYTALSLVAPEKIRFRYKLEGLDRDWQEVGNRRQAFYTNLAPGNYTFRVMACNNSGVWNEAGATLDFVIPPAWYQTTWFRGLGVLALLAMVYAAYRIRVGQLRAQEEKFREAIESIPAMAFISRADGYRTFVNKVWVEYTGLTVEQSSGSGWYAAIHPEDRKLVSAKWDVALASGEPTSYEARYRRAEDGQYRWFMVRGVPLRDRLGKIVKWYGIVTDIEDRKSAEDALRQSQFYHTEGQRLAQMGSWAYNPAGFFDYWSEELFQVYGLDPQMGPPTLERYLATLHPEDRDSMAEIIKEMHAQNSGCDVRKRIIRPDGELRYIRCVGIPVVEGELLKGFVGTAMDITEQELLTQELERRQAYLSEAQKLTHTGSCALTPAGVFDYWSSEMFQIHGLCPRDKPPTTEEYLALVHPEDRDFVLEKMQKALADRCECDFTRRIVRPDGKIRRVRCVGRPLIREGIFQGMVGTGIDVTEQDQLEQERERLRQLEAELAHINRVSMLGEMAASLAHEIKQPITAAINSANSCIRWLAQETPNLERARSSAARVEKDGTRAAQIIDHLRSLYKKSPPERESVDVNGVIQEMLALLRCEADRYLIAISTELASELPKIMADRIQLQQVFMNLMVNGIEAMKDLGGELTVQSQLRDGQLQFSVSDTGVGLPNAEEGQIFSAFFTTKPQGSGMGLAISRSIVESHGGRLWAAPNGQRGSIFFFTLPTEETASVESP